jgi:hypothetical protein
VSEPAEYSVRAYAPGDEAAIQRAFSEVFGVERSLAEWRWKFLAPPRGSRILLAFDGAGELVCQYAAIAVDVAWGGAPKRAAQIVDVFSRRRRGLGRRGGAFQRTMEQFLAECAATGVGVDFVYGFPGERHQRAGSVTGHYFDPAEVERLTFRRPVVAPAGERNRARSWISAHSWISEGFDAHATDRLWQRSRHRYPHATVRDAAWFEWRYERRPGGRYLQLGVRRAGEVHAWEWSISRALRRRAGWTCSGTANELPTSPSSPPRWSGGWRRPRPAAAPSSSGCAATRWPAPPCSNGATAELPSPISG